MKENKTFIHSTSVVSEDSTIGTGSKIWHFSHIFGGSSIGKNCIIGQNVMIGPGVKIGNGCKIQNNVSIYQGVILEDEVFCGPSCVFTNVKNPRAFINRKNEFKKTIIRKGASIGANSTLICGIEIGRYALIAAGALVSKNVKPFSLMIGIPAKFKGWVSEAGEILKKNLVCPRTGKKYVEKKGDLYFIN